jgi:hypothetical protein
MFQNPIRPLRTSETNDKSQKKTQNGLKRRWNLGENYKPSFDSKSIPNIKLLKKIRIGKFSLEIYYRMHLFNHNLCSNSKIDTTLIGHYMKSFLVTITKYFSIYDKLINDHLDYLKQNSSCSMHEFMMSMVQNSLALGSLKGFFGFFLG